MNLKDVQTEWISKENILQHISEYDIYAYYLGNFATHTVMSSPFRKDNNPSFGVYLGRNGVLMFNDYKLGSGDCFKFVSMLEQCNYYEALVIVNKRYNLNFLHKAVNKESLHNHIPIITNTSVHQKAEVWIDIKIRPWDIHDKEFWSQYEISLTTLTYFNVFPISKFWINNAEFKADKYAYAYYFNDREYKIYQPLKTIREGKFWSNIKNRNIYQGDNQLPESGEILILTSSLKDVMVLYEIGYTALAPHSEHQILTPELYEYYQKHWGIIYVFYDNDEAGILHANKMKDQFGLKILVLPESDTKDPSDFVKKYDLTTLKQWIQSNT